MILEVLAGWLAGWLARLADLPGWLADCLARRTGWLARLPGWQGSGWPAGSLTGSPDRLAKLPDWTRWLASWLTARQGTERGQDLATWGFRGEIRVEPDVDPTPRTQGFGSKASDPRPWIQVPNVQIFTKR